MPAIDQFTQSRLSLLLVNKTTDALLNAIPVYAEMAITVESPPYAIHQQLEFVESETPVRQWLQSHPSVLNWINNAIVANAAEDDFDQIADKHSFYLAILEELRGGWIENET